VLGESTGSEDWRRGDLGNGCPAATAGTLAPASRQPDQVYTRACKHKWCKRKG
jgi:hypothetical protein